MNGAPTMCAFTACARVALSRGWCDMHYRRWLKHGDASVRLPAGIRVRKGDDLERLLSKIAVTPDGCWEWTASRSKSGYGQVGYMGRVHGAHRVAYMLLVGPIPDGLELDHLCRNRACINTDHLEPVTGFENVARGVGPTAPAMRENHCVAGHEFTDANTWRDRSGWRHCRACNHRRGQERKARLAGRAA